MKFGKYFLWVLLFMATPLCAEPSPYDSDPDKMFASVYQNLGISLPSDIARDSTVWLKLDELRREPCDRRAIVGLAKGLQAVGYKRQAADGLMAFIGKCGGPVEGYRTAANIYMNLSDFDHAVVAADELVRHEPTSHSDYYVRARALSAAKYYDRALDDYASVIELFADKKRISSNVFVEEAEAFDALKRPCEAMAAIRTWVSFDPENRETSQAHRLIDSYAAKGACEANAESRTEKFPLRGPGAVVVVTAEINGVKGKFVLDTGASFLSLSSSFSEKAGVVPRAGSQIVLNTANGDTEGMLGKADSVRLGSLQAKDVSVIVQKDQRNLYGNNDGLLGMSFLSRFNVSLANGFIAVSTKSH